MQFDVHPNPIVRDRKMRPFVVVLQSDASLAGPDRIVAPLVRLPNGADRPRKAMPVVNVGEHKYLLHLPSVSGLPSGSLKRSVGSIAQDRSRIVDALDWLFLGI
jgi:hypothetical protein